MFKSARIKLTLSYILIIMAITLSFSIVIYTGVEKFTQRALKNHETKVETRLKEFRGRANMPSDFPSPRFQEPITQETALDIKKDTISLLAAINLISLVFSGSFGYWFAGKTLRPIEEMTDKQKKFVADAAHELKTPLTAIKSQLEVTLRNKKLGIRESKKVMRSVVQDVDTLTLLTNSLLKESKYQDIYSKLELKQTNLSQLILEVLKKFEPKIKHKKISVNTKVDTKLHAKVDKNSFTELITILIDNAVKFNKREGKLEIEAYETDHSLIIKITNTGEKIDPKDMPFIFDRFYKADKSRSKTKEHDGFGLGLSIAKEIIEKHKGNISGESNHKTTFTITLPK